MGDRSVCGECGWGIGLCVGNVDGDRSVCGECGWGIGLCVGNGGWVGTDVLSLSALIQYDVEHNYFPMGITQYLLTF